MSGAKRRNFFFVMPSTFLALQVQSVVLVSASVWSVQFDHFLDFLFFLLSVPQCPVICKSVCTCPLALDGVTVTFVLQFHTRKHYKTAIQSECIASQRLFPIFAFKITLRVILLTRFCILLTRVATPSGGTCLKCLNGTTFLVSYIGTGSSCPPPDGCFAFLPNLPTCNFFYTLIFITSVIRRPNVSYYLITTMIVYSVRVGHGSIFVDPIQSNPKIAVIKDNS